MECLSLKAHPKHLVTGRGSRDPDLARTLWFGGMWGTGLHVNVSLKLKSEKLPDPLHFPCGLPQAHAHTLPTWEEALGNTLFF